jgi:glucose-1-phosphate cytidylyltransferase
MDFHRSHGCLATVTAVQPPGRFGALVLEGQTVAGFAEKPQGDGGFINGGFFVLDPDCLGLVADDATKWEEEPMRLLAERDQLLAFKHGGFWQPMDTLRDRTYLEELWATGNAPWRVW